MGILVEVYNEKRYNYNINNASDIDPWYNYYSSKAQISFAIFTINQ